MLRQQQFYRRPNRSQVLDKRTQAKIPETHMHNPGRWLAGEDPMAEICILGDDNQALLSGMLPDHRV